MIEWLDSHYISRSEGIRDSIRKQMKIIGRDRIVDEINEHGQSSIHLPADVPSDDIVDDLNKIYSENYEHIKDVFAGVIDGESDIINLIPPFKKWYEDIFRTNPPDGFRMSVKDYLDNKLDSYKKDHNQNS